ncbi:MAG: hypothetical protein KAU06_09700 [Candidatus Marinimicrobia bacterium]|nr:hypothetical protein [Candidatus Neomarinimicrobiota bacterium]
MDNGLKVYFMSSRSGKPLRFIQKKDDKSPCYGNSAISPMGFLRKWWFL